MNEDFESIRQYKANQRRTKRQAEATAKSASVVPCDTRLKVILEGTPEVILCEADHGGISPDTSGIASRSDTNER